MACLAVEPSIESAGGDLKFTYGEGDGVELLLSEMAASGAVRIAGTADLTSVVSLAFGDADETDTLRIAFSVAGCAAAAAPPFSTLVAPPDFFVTTANPSAFLFPGDATIATVEGGGYMLMSRAAGGGRRTIGLMLGNFPGCPAAAYTAAVTSSTGSFVAAPSGAGAALPGNGVPPMAVHFTATRRDVLGMVEAAVAPLRDSDAVPELLQDVKTLKAQMASTLGRLSGVQGTLSTVTGRVGTLQDDMGVVQRAVAQISDCHDSGGVPSEGGSCVALPKNCDPATLPALSGGGTWPAYGIAGETVTPSCADGWYATGSTTCAPVTGQYTTPLATCAPCASGCAKCDSAAQCTACAPESEPLVAGKCAGCSATDAVNLLAGQDATVTTSAACYTGGGRLLPKFLVDGKPQGTSGSGYLDKDYFHSCRGDGVKFAEVAVAGGGAIIRALKLTPRCDCCPNQNMGVQLMVREKSTQQWRNCGAPIASHDEYDCQGDFPLPTWERSCPSVVADRVRAEKDATEYMVIAELQAMGCAV